MCLIDILSRIKDEYGIMVKAVHINHNIRGAEALRDAEYVTKYCETNGIEIVCFSVDVPSLSRELGISEEECGRRVRYDCFEKVGCDAVATAHTMSDTVETVLFNLARGTGIKGLSGIPAKRKPNIIRPLIDCTRFEIEEYCKDNSLDFMTDSTNLTDNYKRNYIRHRIVPLLSEINPSVIKAIGKTAEVLSEESDFIEECACNLLKNAVCDDGYKIFEFLSSHPAVRKCAIKILLHEKMSKPVEQKHINISEEVINGTKGKAELSDGLYISVNDGIIHFRRNDIISTQWTSEVVNNKFSTPFGEYEIVKTDDINGIDLEKVKNKLVASSRREGDKIYIKKRKITKSLKKIYNEMKIPFSKRNELAVLRDGERVVWVEGIGTDGNYLPEDNSKNIVFIKKDVQKYD